MVVFPFKSIYIIDQRDLLTNKSQDWWILMRMRRALEYPLKDAHFVMDVDFAEVRSARG